MRRIWRLQYTNCVYVLLLSTCHIQGCTFHSKTMWQVYSNFLSPYCNCPSVNLYWCAPAFICSPLARNAKLNWMNDLLKTCKQPVFHLLRCQYSLDCSLFENCHSRKGVQQILQINWMHLKPNDSEIMCDPLCRVITVSMILAQHLFTLVTWLNSTRSWEDSHFGSESWWCTVLTATTWMCHLAAYCSFNVIIHVSALFGQMWIGHFVLPNQN